MRYAVWLLATAAYAQAPIPGPILGGGSGGGGGGGVTSITTSCGIAGGTITTTGNLNRAETVDSQTGSGPFAIPNADCGLLVFRNQAAAVSDTLAAAGSGGGFGSGWLVDYQCAGAGGCTITATTSTFDAGGSVLTLTQGQGVRIVSNGTNYFTQRGVGGAGTAPYTVTGLSVTAGQSKTITHNLGDQNVILKCQDSTTFGTVAFADTDATSNTITFTPMSSQTVNCKVTTGGTGPPGPAGTTACTITFTAQTTVTIAQGTSCDGSSTHGFATGALLITVYDNSVPANLSTATVTVNQSTFAIVVTLAQSTTGKIVISAGGGGPIGQTGQTGATGPPKGCMIVIGDPGSASPVLADDNDSPAVCGNQTGGDLTITAVALWANAGTPSITPILTAGGATSILTGACTGSAGAWTACTINGTPTLHTFSANAATCSVTPCTLDANITTAGGTAKYIVIQVRF